MACSLYICFAHFAITIHETIWMFVTDLPSYAPVPDAGLTKEVFSSVDVYDTNSLRCTLNIYSEKISVKQNLSSGQLYAIPNAVCRNDKYC